MSLLYGSNVQTTITGIHSVIIIIIPPESKKVRITIVLAGALDPTPFWFISRKAAVTFAPAKNEFWAHCGCICTSDNYRGVSRQM